MIAILKNLLFALNSIQPQQNHGRRHYPRNRPGAGFTAGIYTARANLNPLILEGGAARWPATTTSEVENFPGFPEGIDGYDLMDQLAQTSGQVRCKGRECVCGQGRFQRTRQSFVCAGDRKLEAKTVIIATGAAPRLLNIRGVRNVRRKGVTTWRNL